MNHDDRDHAEERANARAEREEHEREAARPNDPVRAALLDALDLADRAGVQLSAITAYCYLGKVSSVDLHGSRPESRMRHTDALRIALRAGRRSAAVTVGDPILRDGTTPYVQVTVTAQDGAKLTMYAEPSPAQLAALTFRVCEAQRYAAGDCSGPARYDVVVKAGARSLSHPACRYHGDAEVASFRSIEGSAPIELVEASA